MSFKLAEAFVELNTKGFGTVSGRISGVRSALSGLMVAGGAVAGTFTAIAAAVAAPVAAFGVLGRLTIPLAAGLEQTRVQFGTLLGSMDLAVAKIEELQRFAAGTPFQFEGLAEATKTLLAFQVSNEQTTPTLKTLGDIAAATGNDLNGLAQIYGKVKARGALMTEQLDQLNERGIPVAAKLGEMLGKTGSEIRDMASSGELSFGQMQRAMIEMTSEGGMAFNGMASQSTTLSGVWSTMKDNITLVMTDIGGAIVEGFDLTTIVSNFTGFVQNFRNDWLPSIVEGFRWVGENIVGPFHYGMQYLTEQVGYFVNNFDLHMEHLKLSVANKMNDAWQYTSTFFQNGVTLAGWFADNALEIFGNLWDNAGQLFENYVQQFKNNWQSLLDFFRTGRFEFDFSPLQDSLELALEGIELPELASAQLGEYDRDLERLRQRMAARNQARWDERKRREADAHDDRIAQLEVEDAAAERATGAELERQKAITKEQQTRAASFVSVSGLAERMQQMLQFRGKEDAQAKDARERDELARAVLAIFAKSDRAQGLQQAEQDRGGGGATKATDTREKDGLAQGALNIVANAGDRLQAGGGGAMEGARTQQQQISLLQRQVDFLGGLHAQATGAGLKVDPPAPVSIDIPVQSVAFGGGA